MASAYKTLYRGQLSNAVGVIYTAGAAAIIKHISIVNNDSADRTFSLYRNGTTAAYVFTPTAMVCPTLALVEWDGTMALESGGTIAGVASVDAKLTCIICGDEES